MLLGSNKKNGAEAWNLHQHEFFVINYRAIVIKSGAVAWMLWRKNVSWKTGTVGRRRKDLKHGAVVRWRNEKSGARPAMTVWRESEVANWGGERGWGVANKGGTRRCVNHSAPPPFCWEVGMGNTLLTKGLFSIFFQFSAFKARALTFVSASKKFVYCR